MKPDTRSFTELKNAGWTSVRPTMGIGSWMSYLASNGTTMYKREIRRRLTVATFSINRIN